MGSKNSLGMASNASNKPRDSLNQPSNRLRSLKISLEEDLNGWSQAED
jgi:hypothetical protein